jgi:hypothetical protein
MKFMNLITPKVGAELDLLFSKPASGLRPKFLYKTTYFSNCFTYHGLILHLGKYIDKYGHDLRINMKFKLCIEVFTKLSDKMPETVPAPLTLACLPCNNKNSPKPVFTLANITAKCLWLCCSLTCLGLLGQCDTNRNNHICVKLPK